MGTLRYMAPECFRGTYDVRGDVYGLGLVLYELLATAPAFVDVNRAALVRQITQEAPARLRTRDPGIPTDFATIVQKAIAPDPALRYPTDDEPAQRVDLASHLQALALAPDGRTAAAAGADGIVYLLETDTWTVRHRLAGHAGEVRGLAFHPRGHVLASVSVDQTARLWDPVSGEALAVLSETDPDLGAHTDALQVVTFHPGGTRLVTGSRNSSVDVWDWERGQLLSTLQGPWSWVHGLAFGPAGERLLSCHSHGTLRVWGTQTAAEREPILHAARLRRDAVEPIVARLLEQTGDLDAVILALESEATLDPTLRESALRIAHARLGTGHGLKKRLWRMLSASDGDADAWRQARAVTSAFARTHALRAHQDSEGILLHGIANYRVAPQDSGYYLERAVALHAESPELRAIALAFLVMSDAAARREDLVEQSSRNLEAYLATHPEAHSRRVEAFVAEVRAAYDARPR